MKILRYVLLGGLMAVSAALYLHSLGLPAVEFHGREPLAGSDVLFVGWLGVMTGDFPWFANPLYAAAPLFLLLGRRTASLVCSATALALGSLSLRVHTWYFDESGQGTPVEGLGPAFSFWMGSFVAMFLASCLAALTFRPVRSQPPPPVTAG